MYAGVHFGIFQDELGLAVFLRHCIHRLHVHRAERLLARHQIIRTVESGKSHREQEKDTFDESHNGFDILTKWQGKRVATSGGNSPVPHSAYPSRS